MRVVGSEALKGLSWCCATFHGCLAAPGTWGLGCPGTPRVGMRNATRASCNTTKVTDLTETQWSFAVFTDITWQKLLDHLQHPRSYSCSSPNCRQPVAFLPMPLHLQAPRMRRETKPFSRRPLSLNALHSHSVISYHEYQNPKKCCSLVYWIHLCGRHNEGSNQATQDHVESKIPCECENALSLLGPRQRNSQYSAVSRSEPPFHFWVGGGQHYHKACFRAWCSPNFSHWAMCISS